MNELMGLKEFYSIAIGCLLDTLKILILTFFIVFVVIGIVSIVLFAIENLEEQINEKKGAK